MIWIGLFLQICTRRHIKFPNIIQSWIISRYLIPMHKNPKRLCENEVLWLYGKILRRKKDVVDNHRHKFTLWREMLLEKPVPFLSNPKGLSTWSENQLLAPTLPSLSCWFFKAHPLLWTWSFSVFKLSLAYPIITVPYTVLVRQNLICLIKRSIRLIDTC